MTDHAPIVVSLGDAALQYDLPQRTLRRWVAEGRLINHGTPRRIYLDLWEVDQLYRMRAATGSGTRLPRST